MKNMLYFAQVFDQGCDGLVREFNYDMGPITASLVAFGLKESMNMKVYGSPQPPLQNPENIRVPIKLYYSDGDDFTPEAVSLSLSPFPSSTQENRRGATTNEGR